ncbi:hypothetical protein SADUNF_Sadunf06G0107000 [Salix dunnii]|uniref:Phosphatidic acid phosphatase type 2/haloperoxidase domain-containing protein n=1 Tax=Salix dunnii TaxID=1413687 RepID=A0A835N0J9_9ROSI|nr:hypothetical protein SADUNF_Sadunf06G0107000 [Salix dunnii]
MPNPPLKAVTLTHVRYQNGDQLGHFLAWVSLVPVFISLGGFFTHFIFRRELHCMFFALGLIISQIINEVIKTSVQQARPETCALLEMCDSHGWPSSHSQYMFFFAVYITLLTVEGIGLSQIKNKCAVIFFPWSLAVLTMFSRVYLGYHTVAQVFAGAALGVFLGACWFWVVNNIIYEYFPVIEESILSMIMQELLERVWLTRLIDQVDSSKRCFQDCAFACVDDMSKQVQFFVEATLFGSPQGKPTRRTSARMAIQ